VSIDHDETAIAFLADLEQLGEDKAAKDVYVWAGEHGMKTRRVAFVGQHGMPPQQRVGGNLTWSRDGNVLSFTVEDAPEPEALPILDDDKVVLDLWNWRDGLLQTMQQKRGSARDDRRTVVWDRAGDRVTVLGDDRTPTLRFVGNDGRYLMASDSRPYEQEVSWDGRYADAWLVDRKTGTRVK
ncbi:MAG: hypothetical protein KDC48_24390, partial [Planctomycetes bacterium]|nr:hypothetical protein [Planctomycetota bacterium]